MIIMCQILDSKPNFVPNWNILAPIKQKNSLADQTSSIICRSISNVLKSLQTEPAILSVRLRSNLNTFYNYLFIFQADLEDMLRLTERHAAKGYSQEESFPVPVKYKDERCGSSIYEIMIKLQNESKEELANFLFV